MINEREFIYLKYPGPKEAVSLIRPSSIWIVELKPTNGIVTAHMNSAAGSTNAVNAYIITDKIMNCLPVSLIKNRKGRTTGP